VKLPLREAGHEALRAELVDWDGYVSSALLGIEAIRACARHDDPRYADDARAWLHDLVLLPLDDAILDQATRLAPGGLRSLDAIHLATALSVQEDIGVLLTYDQRLGEAAAEHGLRVSAPGAF
jgi:predicted nucleic acid-binding protein